MSPARSWAKSASRKHSIYWRRPPDRPGDAGEFARLAVRDGQWKLLCDTTAHPLSFTILLLTAAKRHVAADCGRRSTIDVSVAWQKSMPPDNGPQYSPAPIDKAKARQRRPVPKP
jgi:hypothetical protein